MRRTTAVLVSGALLVAGCSSDDSGTRADSATTVPSTSAAPEPAATEPTGTEPTTGSDAPTDTGVTAGTSDSPTTDAATPNDSGLKPWTVLIYSIADTNLEPFMMVDIDEAGTVGTTDSVNMVALVDRAADYSSDPVVGLEDWQGGKVLEIGQGSATVLADYGPIDTGDPAVLADFITQGIANYPAQHYALIISDHGASWPGVGGDESAGGNGLSLAEITDGISTGLDTANVDKLDLLGFDACLMATYEVASTMAPLADRMVASQELEPGHGWDYRSLAVLDNPEAVDVDTLGTALLDGFAAQAKEQGTKDEITLALLDLTKMGAVDEAILAFSDAVQARVADIAPTIGSVRAKTLGFGRSPDPTEDTQMADLGQLVSQIGVEALDVSDQADATIRALNDVVLARVQGASTLGSTGLSVYFPPTEELLSPDYASVVGESPWLSMLASYYGAGDAIPQDQQPSFSNEGDLADVSFDTDGLTISGLIDPAIAANVSDAYISYGTVDEAGTVTFFGDEPATVADDGTGLAFGTYDLTTLTITDGQDTAVAYLSLTVDESSGVISIDVPMAYYAPGDENGETYQDVLLSLTLDGETGEILSETYYVYDEQLGTYGELTADPAGIIVPEVETLNADGTSEWVPTSDVGLFADLPSLQYDLVPLDSGTLLFAMLTVTDFGGNSDTVSAVVEVP